MKVALAQINSRIGDVHRNAQRVIDVIASLKGQADLVVFPEMVVPGYPPRDLLDEPDFVAHTQAVMPDIQAATQQGPAALVGSMVPRLETGRRFFNRCFLFGDGQVLGWQDKQLLPYYDVFGEERYFEKGQPSEILEVAGQTLGCLVCEDAWANRQVKQRRRYHRDPASDWPPLDLVINPSASPFDLRKNTARLEVLQSRARQLKAPVIYVNTVGANDELIFDGRSKVINAAGQLCYEAPAFQEEVSVIDLEQLQAIPDPEDQDADLIHRALVLGIKDYFAKTGFKQAVLGLSGGIDSALTATLAVEALGADQVQALALPSPWSSDHSLEDARVLAQNLKLSLTEIPIENLMNHFDQALAPLFQGQAPDITEENIQARIRGTILMAVANKNEALVLTTTNKSEAAVGYGTLYGDLCGALAPLADLYKQQVYQVAHHLNQTQGPVIPENIFNKEPSAELRPGQLDRDTLPPYDVLDAIVKSKIEDCQSRHALIDQGFDADTVDRVLHLIKSSEYKRHQMPLALKVSRRAFGMGRVRPIAARLS